MSSRAEFSSGTVRNELRDHFIGCVRNTHMQQQLRQSYKPVENHDQHLKEPMARSKQNKSELENCLDSKQRNLHQAATSGGDADRMMYYPTAGPQYSGDCYGIRNNDNYSVKQFHANIKPSVTAANSKSMPSSRKYQTSSFSENYMNDRFLYENDSNLGGIGNGSEGSAKSQKSSKTVVSRKSSHDLRKLVTSQCKLHEVIGETLKEMCNTEPENTVEDVCGLQADSSYNQYPRTMSPCKRCTDRLHTVQSQKDVTTEIGKGDLLDCRNSINTLTISVDDVINSRVVNPMIHKLHRMYLNNLKEEMSLMEDLERLPHKVNDVYKSIIFKQKE